MSESGEQPKRRKEDRLPWFPFHLDRWETDPRVRNMGPAARGIYLTLLMMQWREGSIPEDIFRLYRILTMPKDPIRLDKLFETAEVDIEECIEQVLECFTPNGEGGLHNETLSEIRRQQLGKVESYVERGRIGGLKKATNSSLAKLEVSQKVATSKPLANSSDLDLDRDIKPNTKAKAPSAFVLPDWVPQEAWDHYEEMRRKIRKPMTDQARKWAVQQLDRLRRAGNDPLGVLERSVFNSWQGLFPLEGSRDNHAQAGRNDGQRTSTQVQRWNNNLRAAAVAVSEMDGVRSPDSARQAPRLSAGSAEVVDKET